MRKAYPIESWHIESLVGKLRSKDALNPASSKVAKDSLSISFRTFACKNFAWLCHKVSDTFKMLNSSAKNEDRISASDFFICDIRHLSVALVVFDQLVQERAPIERSPVDRLEPGFHRLHFELDRT